MPQHPAIAEGRAAVITGAASGIGLAAAERFADLGMKVCMADANVDALEKAVERVAQRTGRQSDIIGVATDVSKRADVERLKTRAYETFGEVAVLMNNAGRGGGGATLFGEPERWRAILDTNLWGVINGVQVFAPDMIAQRRPAAIVTPAPSRGSPARPARPPTTSRRPE